MTRVSFANGTKKGPVGPKARRGDKQKTRRFPGSQDDDNDLLPDVDEAPVVSPASIFVNRRPKRAAPKRTRAQPPPLSFVVVADLRVPSPISFEADARLASYRACVEEFVDAGRRRRWLGPSSFVLGGALGAERELTALREAEGDDSESSELEGFKCGKSELASGRTFAYYKFLLGKVSSLSFKTRTKKGQMLSKKVGKADGNQNVCLFVPDANIAEDPDLAASAADFAEDCARRANDRTSDLKSFTVVVVLTEARPEPATVAFVEALRGVDVRVVEGHSLAMLGLLKGWCVPVPKSVSTIFLPGENDCTMKVRTKHLIRETTS